MREELRERFGALGNKWAAEVISRELFNTIEIK